MAELIDRGQRKAEVRTLLRDAQVSPKGITALYLLATLLLDVAQYFGSDGDGLISLFLSFLSTMLLWALGAGFLLYCMAVRRGERAEYLILFDGFSFVGKLIALNIIMYLFVTLWSMLFVIPGVIAVYRYRFAVPNLCENPGIGVMEALEMSKQQTRGYKAQLFLLDLSYLGWILLASLFSFGVELENVWNGFGQFGYDMQAIIEALPQQSLPLLIAGGLWTMAVTMFYLPNYQCVELSYFDTAKQTSGVGSGAQRRPDDFGGYGGPDNL